MPTLSELRAPRKTRLGDESSAARSRAADVDRAIQGLLEAAFGSSPSLTLVAVGGYGRGELSPHSDIDIVVLLPPRSDVSAAALRGLLYPLWDAGWRVGHAVRSPKEAISFADGDLDAATSLMTARLIGGLDTLYDELIDRRGRWIGKNRKRLTRSILEAAARRHDTAARAGWSLAPNIKSDIGGLRDIHTLGWLDVLHERAPERSAALDDANDLLLAVREALHAELKRPGDQLRIDLQPSVARTLGYSGDEGADLLMTQIHSRARTVEQVVRAGLTNAAEQILGGPRRSGSVTVLDRGVILTDGVLALSEVTDEREIVSALRLIAGCAATNRPVAPRLGLWLETVFAGDPVPWDANMLHAWFEILRGPHVVTGLELLDETGGLSSLFPEWNVVRGRALYDPYHRYTVDGHSFLTVAEVHRALRTDSVANRAAAEAGDLDSLLIAALLHDIGKGSGDDHSVAGARIARSLCERIGMTAGATAEVEMLVRNHLLLSDTATRRDLDDGDVIAGVAEAVPDARILRLLYILTVADARATGPEAWTNWKSALVVELFRKALIAVETGELPTRSNIAERAHAIEMFDPSLAGRAADILETLPPSYVDAADVGVTADEIRLLLNPPAPGEIKYRLQADDPAQSVLIVCMTDRPGTLARTAGVLTLHRVSVLRAQAFSTTNGLALERFVLQAAPTTDWDRITADLEGAFSGRLAVDARLEKKVLDYNPPAPVTSEVRVLQDASPHSTVIEVRAPDTLGILYAIAAGITDLDFDIHVAKIDTLGERVVDVFYVRTPPGTKLDDKQIEEARRSIRHRVARIYS